MNINELSQYKDFINAWKTVDGYRYIGIREDVCGGEPTIIGTRIEPKHIAAYGTIEETIKDFDLLKEQVEEAIHFTYCYLSRPNK